MSVPDYYRIYCNTEVAWSYGWSTSEPTTCYNNPAHTVNSDSVQLLEYGNANSNSDTGGTIVINNTDNSITGVDTVDVGSGGINITGGSITIDGAPLDLDDLADVDTTTVAPSTGNSLRYNGTEWRPSNPLTVQSGGTSITSTPHNTLNFTGAGVSVANAGSGVATVTINGGGGTFGSGYQTYENTASAATTSTAWRVYATWTTASVTAGTYYISYYYNFSSQKNNYQFKGSLTLDGTEIDFVCYGGVTAAASPVYITGSGTVLANTQSGSKIITFGTTTTHSFVLNYSTSGASSIAAVRNLRITLFRVA